MGTGHGMSRWVRAWGAAGILSGMLLVAGGCEDDEFDHDPPEGMGTLVVDNWTSDRIYVYIDGEEKESVTDDKHRYYDLAPGVYRVVLEGDDNDRTWRDDVDVLDDRLTVLHVREAAFDPDDFDVHEYFD